MFEGKLNEKEQEIYNAMIGNDPDKLTLSLAEINKALDDCDSIGR